MKKFTSLFVFLFSLIAFSQTHDHNRKTWGADIILNKNLLEKPEKIIIRNQLETHTKEFIKTYKNTSKMGQQYIIPVVVHVIHDYGIENISDEYKYKIIPIICKYIFIFHDIHEDEIELSLFTNNLMFIIN